MFQIIVMLNHFFFGKSKGCEFIDAKCTTISSPFDEYCTGEDRGCSAHGRAGGKCTSDNWSNGCKYYSPDELYDCENPDAEDDARFPEIQVYGRGLGSKCFDGTLNNRKSKNGKTTFCFRYTCSGEGENTILNVHIGDRSLKCDREEERVIDGYYGVINCPDPQTFCSTIGKKYCPRNCMGRGTCNSGRCECNNGFTGVDCAIRV